MVLKRVLPVIFSPAKVKTFQDQKTKESFVAEVSRVLIQVNANAYRSHTSNAKDTTKSSKPLDFAAKASQLLSNESSKK